MCFSANANFVASATIAAVGVATLRHVRQPRAVLFAAVPLLFALHHHQTNNYMGALPMPASRPLPASSVLVLLRWA